MFHVTALSTVPRNDCNPQRWTVVLQPLDSRHTKGLLSPGGGCKRGTEGDERVCGQRDIEGDRAKDRKWKKGTNRQKKNNKAKTECNFGVSQDKGDSVGREREREWSSQRDGGGSVELNSKTVQFPDMILNIFCIKRVQRTHSLLTAVWLCEMIGYVFHYKGMVGLRVRAGQIQPGKSNLFYE